MIEQLMSHIEDAIEEAKKKRATREMALVITKLEEARLWLIDSYSKYGESK